MNVNKKYNLSYSAGALLSESFDAVVNASKDFNLLVNGEEKLDYKIIPANAESSQKRYLSEIKSRLKNIPVSILNYYQSADINDKKTIQFYAICRRYQIIVEFMIEVVREKWLNLDYELDKYDYKLFLSNKLAESDDLDSITDNTTYKLTQVFFKMLIELGIYSNGVYNKISPNLELLSHVSRNGDDWFLDVMLLTDEEKKEIKQW